MASFAITRADGSVDKVTDGLSVQDVSDRYGAPGNGSIEAWDDGKHADSLANTFDSPQAQYDAWVEVATKEKQPGFTKAAAASDTTASKGDK